MKQSTEGRWGRWAATAGLVVAMSLLPGRTTAQEGPPDPEGTWALALEGPFAAQTWSLDVSRGGEKWNVVLGMGAMGSAPLENVTWADGTLTGSFTADMHGERMSVTVTTTFSGDRCEGRATGFPMGTMTYSGRRDSAPS